jgi:hypothetical protein
MYGKNAPHCAIPLNFATNVPAGMKRVFQGEFFNQGGGHDIMPLFALQNCGIVSWLIQNCA